MEAAKEGRPAPQVRLLMVLSPGSSSPGLGFYFSAPSCLWSPFPSGCSTEMGPTSQPGARIADLPNDKICA